MADRSDVNGFITALVRALGGHLAPATIRALTTWQRMEGGSTNNPDTYNFLNTTLRVPGSHGTGNVAGVQAYPDFQTGLRATVETLRNGYYAPIVRAIQTGDWRATPALAQALKTWSGGGYSAILGAAGGGGVSTGNGGLLPYRVPGTPPQPPGQAATLPGVAPAPQVNVRALAALQALLAQHTAPAAPVDPGFLPLTVPAPVAQAPLAAFTSPLLQNSYGTPLGNLGAPAR